jgi:hypothetical protein
MKTQPQKRLLKLADKEENPMRRAELFYELLPEPSLCAKCVHRNPCPLKPTSACSIFEEQKP